MNKHINVERFLSLCKKEAFLFNLIFFSEILSVNICQHANSVIPFFRHNKHTHPLIFGYFFDIELTP